MRLLLFLLVSFNANLGYCQIEQAVQPKNFKMLVLAENGRHHIKFTQAAKPWLFSNLYFPTILRNAILWAAVK